MAPRRPLARVIISLYPGYFAVVMATGILSTALSLVGRASASLALLALTAAAYGVLLAASLVRIVVAPETFRKTISDPAVMFTYFTFTAGSNVLATRLALAGADGAAAALGVVGLTSWALLTYWTLWQLTVANPPTDLSSVNGSWLIAVVATESVAVLSTILARALPTPAGLVLVGYAFWAVGAILYLALVTVIMLRLFFRPIRAVDLTPPYWISMGATAITALAGARLLLLADVSRFVSASSGFLEGLVVALWAWGGWWVPFLLLIGGWKIFVLHEPVAYHPSEWSIVFPLGMWSVASWTLAELPGLSSLRILAVAGLAVALAAWVVVGGLYARDGIRWWRRPGSGGPTTEPPISLRRRAS